MSLRTRLAVAFLLMAVVPLLGVTLYSYVTTERAFRRAVQAEARAMAEDMSSRLDTVTGDLGKRLAGLGELPFAPLVASQAKAGDPAVAQLLAQLDSRMGDAAGLVESLEVIPAVPAPPAAPAAPSAPAAAAALEPAQPARPNPPGAAAPPLAPPPAGARPGRDTRLAAPHPMRPPAAREGVLVLRPQRRGEGRPARDEWRWNMKYEEIARAAEAAGRVAEVGAQALEAAAARHKQAAEKLAAEPDGMAGSGRRSPAERERRRSEAAQALAEMARGAAQAAAEAGLKLAEEAQKAGAGEQEGSAARAAAQAAVQVVAEVARHATREASRQMRFHFGRTMDYTMSHPDAGVGELRARIRPKLILAEVFSGTRRRSGEIPFAVDADGDLHAADADRPRLEQAGIGSAGAAGSLRGASKDWIVVTQRDAESGLTLGIARPVGEPLKEIRRTAIRNLGYGLLMVGAALVGILPLSRRMTSDLGSLAEGADRLARGELDVRVPVRSKDEIGKLAETFNRMAGDLRVHEQHLLEKERLRKELELCRRIQEEMLPHERLSATFAEARGVSIPAREVGGDLFNYFLLPDGEAALVVGDVSGKGVAAALLMANIQATLRARFPLERDLTALARHLDEEIDATTPTTVYLTAFLGVLDGAKRTLRYVNAGHNSPFVLRPDGTIEALESTGRPLGLLPGGGFEERSVGFGDGDWLFLYTDGIVECENEAGEPFGNERLQQLLRRELSGGVDALLARVEQAVREFRGAQEAADDATLVALRGGAGHSRPPTLPLPT